MASFSSCFSLFVFVFLYFCSTVACILTLAIPTWCVNQRPVACFPLPAICTSFLIPFLPLFPFCLRPFLPPFLLPLLSSSVLPFHLSLLPPLLVCSLSCLICRLASALTFPSPAVFLRLPPCAHSPWQGEF